MKNSNPELLEIYSQELVIGLVGTYVPDRRMSMIRYTDLLREGLLVAGFRVIDLSPRSIFPRMLGRLARVMDKLWFMYVALKSRARNCQIVHIVDQGDSRYARCAGEKPVVITCHDLYMLQGYLSRVDRAISHDSFKKLGLLERQMLKGLHAATGFVCVSTATLNDLNRLHESSLGKPVRVIYNGFNYPFRVLSDEEIRQRLSPVGSDLFSRPFILHIGQAMARKNRKAVLEVARLASRKTDLALVVAGDMLDQNELLTDAVRELGDKVIQIYKPSNEVLEALYSLAHCLVFPSYFEGFGWPVIEAQACGCPVICSNATSLPEIAGKNALVFDPDDTGSMKDAVLSFFNEEVRKKSIEAGKLNVERFREINLADPMGSLYCECLAGFSSKN